MLPRGRSTSTSRGPRRRERTVPATSRRPSAILGSNLGVAMTRRTLVLATLMAGLALACESRGVSLGTEELCVADTTLAAAAAESTEAISTCARIGKNQLFNAGFETPVVTCAAGNYCQFPAAEVEGWQTNRPGSSHRDLARRPHGRPRSQRQPIRGARRHVSRHPLARAHFAAGPAHVLVLPTPRTQRQRDRRASHRPAPTPEVSQGELTSAEDAWYEYSGLYRVGDDETVTRFALVSHSGLAEGKPDRQRRLRAGRLNVLLGAQPRQQRAHARQMDRFRILGFERAARRVASAVCPERANASSAMTSRSTASAPPGKRR